MKILQVDFQAKDAAFHFLDSIHQSGFAVIHNHGINEALILDNYRQWKVFFDSEEKLSYPFDKMKQTGYVSFRSEHSIYQKDLKNLSEFFNYYPWGMVPATLKNQTSTLHNALKKVGKTLLGWLDSALPDEIKASFSMPLKDMIENSPNHLLRLIHYPALKGNEKPGELRTSKHEDSNLITLLPCPTGPGLQVEDKDGNWQDVSYTNQDIVINVGAQLKLLTQGYLPSTMHRVLNPGNDEIQNVARMSMPLFMHPRDNVLLTDKLTSKQFVDDYLKANGIK